MEHVLLIRGTKESLESANEAIQKFTNIFMAEIDLAQCNTSSEAAGIWTSRPVKLVFIDQKLPDEEVNVFTGAYNKLAIKPLIVCGPENIVFLKSFIPEKFLVEAPHGLSKGFMYDCVRATLGDKDKKLDPRVLASILRSVMSVVTTNTTMPLTPKKIAAVKSKSEARDVSGICAFSGDGIQGTISISTSEKLITQFAEKMLFVEGPQVTGEMRNDLLNEILNQILGAVRQELQKFGYELIPTNFLVVTGEQHLYLSRSMGKYYDMPFSCEDQNFDVTFSYDAYTEFLRNRDERAAIQLQRNILDVRLVNCAIEAVIETLASTFQLTAKHVPDAPIKEFNHRTMSLHCGHGVGIKGNYTFTMSYLEDDARFFASKMLFMPEAEIAIDMIADSCGELLNQITANFRSRATVIGYTFRHVFHGDFARPKSIEYMTRNRGYYLKLKFQTESRPFEVSFGVESAAAEPLFNVYELFDATTAAAPQG
jgi:CheY-specific phosphatase CheX